MVAIHCNCYLHLNNKLTWHVFADEHLSIQDWTTTVNLLSSQKLYSSPVHFNNKKIHTRVSRPRNHSVHFTPPLPPQNLFILPPTSKCKRIQAYVSSIESDVLLLSSTKNVTKFTFTFFLFSRTIYTCITLTNIHLCSSQYLMPLYNGLQ